jgi:archaellum component FlaF (FlaF/FlaG flagellin family)
MKKYNLLLLGIILSISYVSAQKSRTQNIKTPEEFLQEIASNTVLRLKSEKLNFSALGYRSANKNVNVNRTNEGLVIEIRDVDNLTIEGDVSGLVKITGDSRQKPILSFINCKNLTLQSLEIGYSPGNMQAKGTLLHFQNIEGLTLKNITFRGEAAFALELNAVRKANIDAINISGCTQGVMSLRNCSEFYFKNCHFFNNRQFDLINIFDSEKINFEQCRIDFNYTGTGAEYDSYALVNAPLSSGSSGPIVFFKKCIIEENYFQFFCRSSAAVAREDCKLDNNLIVKGYNSNP